MALNEDDQEEDNNNNNNNTNTRSKFIITNAEPSESFDHNRNV